MPDPLPADRAPATPGHCVVQYFYAHAAGERYAYPTGRGAEDAQRLTALYLECALVQAASLALRGADCEQLFVSNIVDPHDVGLLGRHAVAIVRELEQLGVQLRHADYAHRFADPADEYVASRYILDAISAVSASAPPGQCLWFTDLDCFWWAPGQVFAQAPPDDEVGCLFIDYPPDWDVMLGTTPTTVGRFGERLGACQVPVTWVGGELIAGTAATMAAFVTACERLEAEVGEQPRELPAEEHLLSLMGALGRVRYRDLSSVGRRVFTGVRHAGPRLADPTAIGFWHLPGEKGLSFRRTARALLRGEHERLARDFADPERAPRRFNTGQPSLARRVRDDGWLLANAARRALRERLPRVGR
jgi:hypothetical protein